MPQKNWDPQDYDNHCILQYNTSMKMLNDLPLSGDEKILDIGCGTGKITHQIATQRLNNKGYILGLDINKEMINFANNKYKAKNLSFECCDVLTMDHKGEFDLAISFWTLSWVSMKDQLHALINIIDSLNETGKLFLMYPLRHDAYDVVDQVIKKTEWSKYFKDYSLPRSFITEQQYYDLIRDNIPIEFDIKKKEVACLYKDDEEMISSINCWLAHVDQIPLMEEKYKFLIDVKDSYKKYRATTQPIMYYSILEIGGCKNSLHLTFSCKI